MIFARMDRAELERRVKGMEEAYETLSLAYLLACFILLFKRKKKGGRNGQR